MTGSLIDLLKVDGITDIGYRLPRLAKCRDYR